MIILADTQREESSGLLIQTRGSLANGLKLLREFSSLGAPRDVPFGAKLHADVLDSGQFRGTSG
ncbi:hypothetical protein D621_19120 [beta proteobacterium AAP51]|nr:hypothetical protein D621_19120 [beta proteobacterium AAP51]